MSNEEIEKTAGNKKVWWSIILAIVALIIIEGALQARAYMKGNSNLRNMVLDQSTFEYNERFGLELLRASNVAVDDGQTIRSNSFGLRSPEIEVDKEDGEIRVAILGASTVMGHTNPINEETMSYRLETHLQERYPDHKITVINGGILGYGVEKQQFLFDRVLSLFDLDLVVLYPGYNDVSLYCEGDGDPEDHGLMKLALPTWILSTELVSKNTEFLRDIKAKSDKFIDPAGLNNDPFRERLGGVFNSVRNAGVPLLAVTNTRGFRRDMDYDRQMEMAEFSLDKSRCFTMEHLQDVFDEHNEIIIEKSTEFNTPVFRMEKYMPAEEGHFADSIHFTLKGNELFAELVANEIVSKSLLNVQQVADGESAP